jgi:hypothetical protein
MGLRQVTSNRRNRLASQKFAQLSVAVARKEVPQILSCFSLGLISLEQPFQCFRNLSSQAAISNRTRGGLM